MNDDERVTYFGETDARNKRVRFGIKKKDRSRHMYIIGKTGMGKSNCLETLAIQDIQNGEGLAFVDPHGKSADLLLEYVPEHRIKDVIYFAPFDLDYPISFNVLEDVGSERRHLVANGLMSAFKKIWVDAWSARMEYILTNILLALLEYPGSTLMGVNRMLVDKDFRKTIVDNISDPSVKAFWTEEYAKYTDKFAAEAAPAIQNKVGQFVANPLVRNIIGQTHSSFDIRKMMDEKKIFIVNLSKGRVGEANANLLGAMIITKIYLAAMSRADLKEEELEKSAQFYLYVDEFQSFANESFADILSEARKYKLNLAIAHQYIEQMTEEVRAAVFGNVGTMVVFRVGAYDADVFQKEFAPQFTAEDIVNLQKYQMYLKLMIDTVTSQPFSARGMAPIPRPERTFVQEIIASSRAQFAHPRAEVEDEIRRWHIEKIQPVGPDGKPLPSVPGGYGQNPEGSQGPRADRGGEKSFSNSGPRSDFRPSSGDRGDRGGERRRDDRPAGSSFTASTGERREGRDNREGRPNLDSRDRRDNRDDGRRNEQQEGRERERQLREAVSLNYLKDKKEEEAKAKNAEKDAKPQNILALKEALLGILGEGSLPSAPTTESPSSNASNTPNGSAHEVITTASEASMRAQESDQADRADRIEHANMPTPPVSVSTPSAHINPSPEVSVSHMPLTQAAPTVAAPTTENPVRTQAMSQPHTQSQSQPQPRREEQHNRNSERSDRDHHSRNGQNHSERTHHHHSASHQGNRSQNTSSPQRDSHQQNAPRDQRHEQQSVPERKTKEVDPESIMNILKSE